MKKMLVILNLVCLGFGGNLGLGVSFGGQYDRNYEGITAQRIKDLFYGAEFYIRTQALPSTYLEPSLVYLNDPYAMTSSVGLGLGINIQPRLGRFLIAPSFGLKGIMMLNNDMDLDEAIRDNALTEYIESSSPELSFAGFAGLSIFLNRQLAIDCVYRYHQLNPGYGVQMVWLGFSYYINW